MLVELHDHLRPGVSARIKERFALTHRATMIPSVPRDGSAALPLDLSSPEDRALAVNEFRPVPQQWAWLVAGLSDGNTLTPRESRAVVAIAARRAAHPKRAEAVGPRRASVKSACESR